MLYMGSGIATVCVLSDEMVLDFVRVRKDSSKSLMGSDCFKCNFINSSHPVIP